MSYDYNLYCAAPFDPPKIQTTSDCLITIDGPLKVALEDIFEDHQSVVGDRRILFNIHVQGDLNDQDAPKLENWLLRLVDRNDGVLIDLQADYYVTPYTSGQIKPPQKKRAAPKFGAMEFVFEKTEWFYETGFEQMWDIVADVMPAALPVRFGYYEPLQDTVAESGIAGMVASFHIDANILLKAKTPFDWIHTSIPCQKRFEHFHPEHFIKRHHLLGYLRFSLRERIFKDPKQLAKLHDLFKELCIALDVTYAQISETSDSGISWFWYGLPRKPARTVCIGPRYSAVWPAFAEHAEAIGDHHLICIGDGADVAPTPAPGELKEPEQPTSLNPVNTPPNLPEVFPFDYKFDLKTYHW